MNKGQKMQKKQGNSQTISWFYDLYKRKLLNLDPPFQRRSVWTQKYKDYFIDTILLNYPCPPIFLYEEINKYGVAKYSVVDGKQRLTSIFDFIDQNYPVFNNSTITEYREKYFSDFSNDNKISFYSYNISVEYIPTNDEVIIKDIFQRLNKNIAKLTAQELRHAKYDGIFINSAESLNEWMSDTLDESLPKFTRSSINKMRDVEFTALLLLIIEEGAKGYLPDELDLAFNERDLEWEKQDEIISKFKHNISIIKKLLDKNDDLKVSRVKNQADFYGLFGAINNIKIDFDYSNDTTLKLLNLFEKVDNENLRENNKEAQNYYITIRSNTNQTTTRIERIKIIENVIKKA